MREAKKIFRIALVILVGTLFLSGQSKVGTTGAQFLKFGVGSRAISMGEAFVAVANDASALYWNPGGIAWANRYEVLLNHTDWLADTRFNYLGVVIPMPSVGVIGLDFAYFDVGEMMVRTEMEPEGTGEYFSANSFSMGLAYGRNLTDRFSIGFKAKYIQEDIWHMTASSFALDIGTLFTTQFREMKIGMSISNFGPKLRMEGNDALVKYDPDPISEGNNDQVNAYLETEKWSLPLLFRVGVAMDIINNAFNKTTLAVDAIHPNDSDESLNIGLETVWSNLIALRVGWRNLGNDYLISGITLGGGLIYNSSGFSIIIDLAYADYAELQSVQRYTLSISF